MNQRKWILFMILILFATPVSAEYYKYLDKDGNVLYTDDLSVIPENQRTDIKIIDEFQESNYSTSEDGEKQDKQISTGENETTNQAGAEGLEEMRQHLDRKKEVLEKERAALIKERAALIKEEEELTSSRRYKAGKDSIVKRKIKALKEKAEKINIKLHNLQRKQITLNAEFDALNTKFENIQNQ